MFRTPNLLSPRYLTRSLPEAATFPIFFRDFSGLRLRKLCKYILRNRSSVNIDILGGYHITRMTLTMSEIREGQLSSCVGSPKIALVIQNSVEDPVAKATFYVTQVTQVEEDGVEHVSEQRYRYSQLLAFNEMLKLEYGEIRIMRLFPPKKWVGNKEGDFVETRQSAIQNWMTALVKDEETCHDPRVREFFQIRQS